MAEETKSTLRPRERSLRSLAIGTIKSTVNRGAVEALKELHGEGKPDTDALMLKLISAAQLMKAVAWLEQLPTELCPDVSDDEIINATEALLDMEKAANKA